MKNLESVQTISEVIGEDWNKTGVECRRGYRAAYIGDHEVHSLQVIKTEEAMQRHTLSQDVHSDGTIVSRHKLVEQKHGWKVYENDFLHGVETDVFIAAEVPVTVMKKRRVRMGKGFSIKEVPATAIGYGYWYGKYRVVDQYTDLDTNEVVTVQKPVSLTA